MQTNIVHALQCSLKAEEVFLRMGKHPHRSSPARQINCSAASLNVPPRRTRRGESGSLASRRQSSGRFSGDHLDPSARVTPPRAPRRVGPKVAPSPLEPRAVPGHSAFGLFARERGPIGRFPGHHDRDDRARHQGNEDRHGHAGHAGTSLGRAFIRSRARRDPRRVASTPVPRATERFGTETNPDIHPLSIVAVRLIVSLPA